MNSVVTYQRRTRSRQRINRQYRKLIILLLVIICFLLMLFIPSQFSKIEADEHQVINYQTVSIRSGDTLWSLAEEYKLSSSDTSAYIKTVKEINHLDSDELISGQYLIIPVYSDPIE